MPGYGSMPGYGPVPDYGDYGYPYYDEYYGFEGIEGLEPGQQDSAPTTAATAPATDDVGAAVLQPRKGPAPPRRGIVPRHAVPPAVRGSAQEIAQLKAALANCQRQAAQHPDPTRARMHAIKAKYLAHMIDEMEHALRAATHFIAHQNRSLAWSMIAGPDDENEVAGPDDNEVAGPDDEEVGRYHHRRMRLGGHEQDEVQGWDAAPTPTRTDDLGCANGPAAPRFALPGFTARPQEGTG